VTGSAFRHFKAGRPAQIVFEALTERVVVPKGKGARAKLRQAFRQKREADMQANGEMLDERFEKVCPSDCRSALDDRAQ